MKIYKRVINPEGQVEEIVVPLWNAIADKVCDEQIYPLYRSINDFITLYPLCAAESLLNDFMSHLNQDAFLIDLNAATDEDGNIDWEYFFRYNKFIESLNNEIQKKGKDFRYSDFVKDYIDA